VEGEADESYMSAQPLQSRHVAGESPAKRLLCFVCLLFLKKRVAGACELLGLLGAVFGAVCVRGVCVTPSGASLSGARVRR